MSSRSNLSVSSSNPKSPPLSARSGNSSETESLLPSPVGGLGRVLSARPEPLSVITHLYQDLTEVTAPLISRAQALDGAPEDKLVKQLFEVPLLAAINFADPSSNNPVVVDQCIKWLLEEDFPVQAAFAGDGDKKAIEKLRANLDKGKKVVFEKIDAATVFALLRTFVQSLSDPVLTRDLFSEIVTPSRLVDALERIPQENKSLLRAIIKVVHDLCDREERKRGRSPAIDRLAHETLVGLLVRSASTSSSNATPDAGATAETAAARSKSDLSTTRYYALANTIISYILQDPDTFLRHLRDPIVPTMHPGEEIKFRAYRVKVSDFNGPCNLWLTNYRLIIQQDSMRKYPRIPVATILSIELQPSSNKKKRGNSLKLVCKDFQTRVLDFETGYICALFEEALRAAAFPENFTDLYAFKNRKKVKASDENYGWDIYSPAREADRQGVVPAGSSDHTKSIEKTEWRISRVNASWHEVPSYPMDLIVPGLISDSELKKIAGSHMRFRFPVVAWFSKQTGAVLVRGDEPEVGAVGDSQKEITKVFPDVKLIDRFARGQDNVLMLDFGLPKTYALGYPNAQIDWLKFKSNREMQDAYVSMMINKPDSYQAYNSWRGLVKMTLDTATRVAKEIQNGRSVMLVHSPTADWDYVVSSIAHLILDGYYRTLAGFQILIEKEWICFGFGCPFKLGHGKQSDDEQAPAFQLFFECVWIMMQQYPIHFQFTEDLLVFVLDALYSCKYGTFLPANERERDAIKPYTVSVWSAINAKADAFTNPFFEDETLSAELKLRTSVADIKTWSGYYTRHKHSAKTRRAQDLIDGVANQDDPRKLELNGIGMSLLPSSISHLTQLHSLNLARNQFTLMPFHILTLTSLRQLSFEFNPLGLIPADHLYLLGHYLLYLQELNISSTGIDNLPKQVTELKSLRILRMHDNNLRDLPPQFTGLTNLEVMDMRGNRLDELPKGLSNMPQLRVVALGRNAIEKLPSDFGKIPNLAVLELCENRLDKFPKGILALTSLEVLHLQRNQLSSLPETFSELTQLRDLNVSSNPFKQIPEHIFQLTNLRRLGLSEGNFESLPDQLSQLRDLETLLIDKNAFTKFPRVVLSLPKLCHLHLQGNQIAEPLPHELLSLTSLCELNLNSNKIPTLDNIPRLGRMSNLRSLSIKENLITTLPITLGLLQDEMENLEVDADKMVDPRPEICNRGTAAIMHVLWDRLTSSDPTYRLRVVLVGPDGPTKSALVQALGKPLRGPRDGDDSSATIKTSTMSLPGVTFAKSRRTADVAVSLWDFTSEEISYTLQSFYWSERTVYVVVTDLHEDKQLDKFFPWAFALRSAAPRAPIIVVGAHEDDSVNGNELVSACEALNAKKYPAVKSWVSANVGSSPNATGFVKALSKVASELSYLGEEIPYSFIQLERLIVCEAATRKPPLATWEEFVDMAASCEISPVDVPRAARYLTQVGTIIYYDMNKLRDTVILDPRYLSAFLNTVLRYGREKAKDGILRHSEFSTICKPPLFPQSVHPFLLSILERFEIAFKLRYTATDLSNAPAGSPPVSGLELRSFIPALLPMDQPGELDRLWPTFLYHGLQFGRRWTAPTNGGEFIARVMARLMHFCPKQLYWRNGILIEVEGTSELILVEHNVMEKAIDVLVRPRSEKLSNLFRHVMETVDTVRRLMKLQSVVQVPCAHCLADGRQGTYYFPIGDCERAAMRGRQLYCRGVRPVRIEALVPDLAMGFYAGKTLALSEFNLQKKIGEGAAAEVFKGTWSGAPDKLYAVKRLRITDTEETDISDQLISATDDQEISKAFAEFRREVWLMASLKHPAIVNMLGVVMHPLSIVTEFVSGGNLFDFIHIDKINFDWPVRLKIALDICAGMTFMHSFKPPITHRDLKTPNILLTSRKDTNWEKEPIVAKVTDFGLTGYAPTLAGREVDNPVWLAPEVMRNEEYTEKADVYSFAVIMYELLTRTQFMGHHSFLSDIENKVILGERPPIPDSEECQQVPEWNELMMACWEHDAEKRPHFAYCYDKLKEIRDKYFPTVSVPPAVTTTVMGDQSFASPKFQDNCVVQMSNAQLLGSLKDPPEQGPLTSILSTEDLDGLWVGQRNGKVVLWQYKHTESPNAARTSSPSSGAKQHLMEKQGSVTMMASSGIVGSIVAHTDAVVALCHYQGRVWTAGNDKLVKEWRPIPRANGGSTFAHEVLVHQTGLGENDKITCMLAFDRYLLAGTKSGYLKVLDTEKNKWKKDRRLKDSDKDRGGVKCLVAVPKAGQIWVGMTNRIVRCDNKLSVIDYLPSPEAKVMSMLVYGGTSVWCACSDGVIRVRNPLDSQNGVKELAGHFSKVYSLVQAGRHIWSVSKDGMILLWDAAQQTILGELKNPGSEPPKHLVLVRRREIWSGCADGALNRWSLDDKSNVALDDSAAGSMETSGMLEESDSDSVSDSNSVSDALTASQLALAVDGPLSPGESTGGRLLKRKRSRRPQADATESSMGDSSITIPLSETASARKAQRAQTLRPSRSEEAAAAAARLFPRSPKEDKKEKSSDSSGDK